MTYNSPFKYKQNNQWHNIPLIINNNVIFGYYYNNNFYKEPSHDTRIERKNGCLYFDFTTANIYVFQNSGYIIVNNDNKEDKSNKITTITESSTNTEYPSGKAVYDLFNSIINADEELY